MNHARASWGRAHARTLGVVFACACHKASPAVLEEAGSTGAAPEAATLEAGPASPRCAVTGTGSLAAAFGLASSDAQDFDVGEGLFASGGVRLGVLRPDRGVRVASIARVWREGSSVSFVDLGRVSSSASPPTVFARGDEVFAVGNIVPEEGGSPHGEAGRWSLFRLGAVAEPLVTLPETGRNAEQSILSATAAPAGSPFGAVLAWDEDAASAKGDSGDFVRGVIRVAFIAQDMRTATRVDIVSPESSDAERPQVTAREDGYWIAWIARKADLSMDAPAELEEPGEERAFRWVELLALDAQGKPVGPVRRLTGPAGHASGFEMETRAPRRLDVFVKLDDERGGGGGGVAHLVVGPDGPPRTAPGIAEGVGRGTAPWLVRSPAATGLLVYTDPTDHARAVALDSEGNPAGDSSLEPSLDEARPVAAATGRGWFNLLAVTSATGNQASLRWLACEPQP